MPDPPRKVAVPLAVGAWVNANAFGVLAFRPELKEHPVYKTAVIASFVSTSWGFTGLAAVAWKRWLGTAMSEIGIPVSARTAGFFP